MPTEDDLQEPSSTTSTSVPTRTRHSGALLAVLLVAPLLAQADATIANVAMPAVRPISAPPARRPSWWSVAT